MQNDRLNKILEQYGCGPIQFTGTSDALYERHLIFDHVTDPKKATRANSLRRRPAQSTTSFHNAGSRNR
ncbi:MAG: hypothetical protein ACREIG_00620 [Nitrospiraceae bacterium]